MSFAYIFHEKNVISNNGFFFLLDYSFLFILFVWVKVAHVPWRKCTRLQHRWPGLQIWSPSPFLPVPGWCMAGEAAGNGSFPFSICLPSAATARSVGGRGGCSHSPSGPVHYLCLKLGWSPSGGMDPTP